MIFSSFVGVWFIQTRHHYKRLNNKQGETYEYTSTVQYNKGLKISDTPQSMSLNYMLLLTYKNLNYS